MDTTYLETLWQSRILCLDKNVLRVFFAVILSVFLLIIFWQKCSLVIFSIRILCRFLSGPIIYMILNLAKISHCITSTVMLKATIGIQMCSKCVLAVHADDCVSA